MSQPQKPSIGRVVHYIPTTGQTNHCAALIIGVGETQFNWVSLVYWDCLGCQHADPYVAEDQSGTKLGTWHWPERE